MGLDAMLLTSDGQGYKYGRESILNGFLMYENFNYLMDYIYYIWHAIKRQGVDKLTLHEYLKKFSRVIEWDKGKKFSFPIDWRDHLEYINKCLAFVDSLALGTIIVSRNAGDAAFYDTEYIQFWTPGGNNG